jgi:hypothetical protein
VHDVERVEENASDHSARLVATFSLPKLQFSLTFRQTLKELEDLA